MELDNSFEGESFINQIIEPSSEIKISVKQAKTKGHGFTAYISYVIQANDLNKQIQRRYSEFDTLRNTMIERWPGHIIPFIPRKYIGRSNTLMVINQRIQYFTYFLNCIAKKEYLYKSEEFQLFLHSNSPDISKVLKELPKLKFEEIKENLKKAFPEYKYEGKIPMQLQNKYGDNVLELVQFLKKGKIPLINIKSELRSLALKKQNYMKKLKLIYNDSIIEYENHLLNFKKENVDELKIMSEQSVKQKIEEINFEKNKNAYWLLYEVLRLQIDESSILVEASQNLQRFQGQKRYAENRIQANNQELEDIKNNNFTLRKFLSTNVRVLQEQIEKEKMVLQNQIQVIEQIYFISCSKVVDEVVQNFNKNRAHIWKLAWKTNVEGEKGFHDEVKKLLALIK